MNSELTDRSFLKDFGRFVLFLLLFSLFPVGIACFLGFYGLSIEEEFRRNQAATRLERGLSGLIRKIDPLNYLEDKLPRFIRQLFSGPLNDRRIVNLHRNAVQRWGIAFEPYIFDDSGILITPKSIPLKTRFVMQKIWDILRTTPKSKPGDILTYKKTINNWMGGDFLFPFLEARRGKAMVLRSRGADGAILWEAAGQSFGGILLMIWEIPTHSQILEIISRKKTRHPLTLASFDDKGNHKFFWNSFPSDTGGTPPLGEPPASVSGTPPNLFAELGDHWCYRDGFIWNSAVAGDLSLVAGRTEQGLDLQIHRKFLVGGAIFFCFAMSVFWGRWLLSGKDSYVSIKMKLVLLFVFALIVPMMGIAFLGYRILRDREAVLISDRLKEAGEILTTFDNEFIGEKEKVLTLFRKLRNDPELPTDPVKVRERAKAVEQDYRIIRFEIRDITGKIMQTTDDPYAFQGLTTTFEGFAKTAIERFLPERWNALKEKPKKKFDVLSTMILENPDMGFTYIIDRPDLAHPLKFGTNDLFWYWDVFKSPSNPLAFITMSQSIRNQAYWFLKTRLRERFGQFRVFACWQEMGRWYPMGLKPNAEMSNLMDRIRISRQAATAKFSWRGRSYHAFGMPGRNLRDHGMMALYPDDLVQNEISGMRYAIVLGMILAFFVAVMTGFALSDQFLTPINEIALGIQALSSRDTDFRVEIIHQDELGDLSEAFNKMMAELKEMQMAKIVQESLIPHTMPVIPGYQIDLMNISASDLGGDYCDTLPMKDGKFLFVIGDVTGHGASSALLMAMAKAVTFQFAEEGGNLQKLMRRLNNIIFHVLKRKKLMTFFSAMLDPATGKLNYSVAGHPFSYLCINEGAVKPLEMVRLPLGLANKGRNEIFDENEIQLNPGDILFMYTDGLVEAIDKNGEMFGYKHLESFLKSIMALPADKIKDSVVKEFYRHRGGHNELDDDLTLGVLKRNV